MKFQERGGSQIEIWEPEGNAQKTQPPQYPRLDGVRLVPDFEFFTGARKNFRTIKYPFTENHLLFVSFLDIMMCELVVR